MSKPHAKVPICKLNASIVFLGGFAVCDGVYHEAKSLCVASFDILVVFHTRSLVQIHHLLSVAFSSHLTWNEHISSVAKSAAWLPIQVQAIFRGQIRKVPHHFIR